MASKKKYVLRDIINLKGRKRKTINWLRMKGL